MFGNSRWGGQAKRPPAPPIAPPPGRLVQCCGGPLWQLRPMTEAPGVPTPALPLARIALGCGNFGGVGSAPEFFGQGLGQDEAFAVMDAVWEAGITHFDTVDAYGGGRSESAIKQW